MSDEAGKGENANFTGVFLGACAQDLSGRGLPADIAWMRYRTWNEGDDSSATGGYDHD